MREQNPEMISPPKTLMMKTVIWAEILTAEPSPAPKRLDAKKVICVKVELFLVRGPAR